METNFSMNPQIAKLEAEKADLLAELKKVNAKISQSPESKKPATTKTEVPAVTFANDEIIGGGTAPVPTPRPAVKEEVPSSSYDITWMKQIEDRLIDIDLEIEKQKKKFQDIIFIEHPNINTNLVRLTLLKASEDEDADKSASNSDEDDNDEILGPFIAHPNIDFERNPEIRERLHPKCNFIAHPNIRLERIDKYQNCFNKSTEQISKEPRHKEDTFSTCKRILSRKELCNCDSTILIDSDETSSSGSSVCTLKKLSLCTLCGSQFSIGSIVRSNNQKSARSLAITSNDKFSMTNLTQFRPECDKLLDLSRQASTINNRYRGASSSGARSISAKPNRATTLDSNRSSRPSTRRLIKVPKVNQSQQTIVHYPCISQTSSKSSTLSRSHDQYNRCQSCNSSKASFEVCDNCKLIRFTTQKPASTTTSNIHIHYDVDYDDTSDNEAEIVTLYDDNEFIGISESRNKKLMESDFEEIESNSRDDVETLHCTSFNICKDCNKRHNIHKCISYQFCTDCYKLKRPDALSECKNDGFRNDCGKQKGKSSFNGSCDDDSSECSDIETFEKELKIANIKSNQNQNKAQEIQTVFRFSVGKSNDKSIQSENFLETCNKSQNTSIDLNLEPILNSQIQSVKQDKLINQSVKDDNTDDSTEYCKKYYKMKYEIEMQNYHVEKMHNELQKKIQKGFCGKDLTDLEEKLEAEVKKLREMVDFTIKKQHQNKDQKWGPIPISTVENFNIKGPFTHSQNKATIPRTPSNISNVSGFSDFESKRLNIKKEIIKNEGEEKLNNEKAIELCQQIKKLRCAMIKMKEQNETSKKDSKPSENELAKSQLESLNKVINGLMSRMEKMRNNFHHLHTELHMVKPKTKKSKIRIHF